MDKNKLIAAGILAIDKNTGDVLLVKRSKLVPNPNKWATVGGKKDPEDENTKETAIREFGEEVQPDIPYKISKKPFYINENERLKFYTYLGIFENKFVPILNEENIEYGWFDLNELPDNLLPACEEMFAEKMEDLIEFINLKIK